MNDGTIGKRPLAPRITVFTIVVVCILGFIYLWNGTGGPTPALNGPYKVKFVADDIKNLRPAGDVRIAGVLIGRVVKQENEGGKAVVEVEIDDEFAPLHDGATVRVGMKSVIGQSFVAVVDGTGAELRNGHVFEGESVIDPVDIDEVVSTFDKPTRKALASLLGSLDPATKKSGKSIDGLLDGVGMLGREGYTAVDAIAAQSKDLAALVNEANTILVALNTGRDQIGSLVRNAQQVTSATAGESDQLAAVVRKLPGLVNSAGQATSTLDGLATDLAPVAADLDRSAAPLSVALKDLPPITDGLRSLLDPMDSSLGRADETLDQVPALAAMLRDIAPDLDTLLANVNPMVKYLAPYGVDIGSMPGNFAGGFDIPLENGVKAVRLAPLFSQYTVRNNPLNLMAIDPLHWNNPYPKPLTAESPGAPGYTNFPEIEKEQ
ncbi:MlaD family protein [Nocardioides daejeonensis]|uniref:MlaD family protein n=1 Tax=Nocardioides daejeonensis TaxID=1046556 RepID=UPI000D746F17|nr:MlaD family protein [Nocardioides daejeonensis]